MLTVDYVRQAIAMLKANEWQEPQPILMTERDAAILGVDAGMPGVVIVPDVRLIPRMESLDDHANQAHGVVR